MDWFEKVKFYYDEGLWNEQRVRNVVGKVIDKKEYEKIVSKPYDG